MKEKIWFTPREALPARIPNKKYSQIRCLTVAWGWSERSQTHFFYDPEILMFNHEHMVWDDSSGDDYAKNIEDVAYWSHLPELPTMEEFQEALEKKNTPKTTTTIYQYFCPEAHYLLRSKIALEMDRIRCEECDLSYNLDDLQWGIIEVATE